MTLIFEAKPAFFYWVYGTLALIWLLILIGYGFHNWSQKRRFLAGDGYGLLFVFTLPMAVIAILFAIERHEEQIQLAAPRQIVQGVVYLDFTEVVDEVVLVNKQQLRIYQGTRREVPSDCWDVGFSPWLSKNPQLQARIEWINWSGRDGVSYACILKVELLPNS